MTESCRKKVRDRWAANIELLYAAPHSKPIFAQLIYPIPKHFQA